MGMIKDLTFDGLSLSDYGVGITGAGVYNAPKRAVNMVTIPGRDGDYALDEGRFENIEITYPAGAFDDDQPDFAEKMSDLRNELASRIGYKRLEDEYNPDEYRLGIFKDGLDVSPAHYSRAGEFDLVFNCKPQRFLTSGEVEQEITSGGTITNPTLFESKPILLVTGYGDIDINGELITVDNVPIGEVIVADEQTGSEFGSVSVPVPTTKLNTGDAIVVGDGSVSLNLSTIMGSIFNSITVTKETEDIPSTSNYVISGDNLRVRCNFEFDSASFQYGTNEQKVTEYTVSATLTRSDSVIVTESFTFTFSEMLTADGIQIVISRAGSFSYFTTSASYGVGIIKADSTKSALGDPMYIDMDIGEAYKVEDGELISVDSAVQLPPDLVELIPGGNAITYDNTITSFKIIPRWWRI